MKGNIFSDSWYKVAKLNVGLHASVESQKQYYRGEAWYVLRSTFSDQFFRMTPEAYQFAALLRTEKSVEEVWEQALHEFPESAPTQDEVIQILAELHSHGMLCFKNIPNADYAFQRRKEKKHRELLTRIFSIISLKIPLGNPDALLERCVPLFRLIVSRYGMAVWLVVVLWDIRSIVAEVQAVASAAEGMLAPSNIPYLYCAIVCMKAAHELGHASVTKVMGGKVTSFGVMLLVLTPLPYVDVSGSWFFRERWQRLLVSCAGMLSDLFIAAVAAVVWAHTGDGITHSVAFNVMILGSVTSIFFNGNPLIRFDAYYLLSDYLEIPNLYERSRRQWFHWFEKYLFGVEHNEPFAVDEREAMWLGLYGIMSFVYRCILTVSIILIVADVYLLLGALFLVVSLVAGVIVPLRRFISYLATSSVLARVRLRAITVSLVIFLAVAALVMFMPVPSTVKAPGVIEYSGVQQVYATTEGVLEHIKVTSGDTVFEGQVIAVLSNRELDLDIQSNRLQREQAMAMIQKAYHESSADVKPLKERIELLDEKYRHLLKKKKELLVVAPLAGVFVSPYIESYKGKWLKRQAMLGQLVSEGDIKFSAIVSQEQAFDLFKSSHYTGYAKLYGSAANKLHLKDITVNPYQKDLLPSAALGWYGGGEIAVQGGDKGGKKTTESFYEVSGRVAAEIPVPLLMHGRSGVALLKLESRPLSEILLRKVRQTVQKRYKI